MATISGHERPSQMMNDHPDGVSGTDQDPITKDSPTFPLYTEVMGKGKAKAEEGEAKPKEGNGSPEVPQKKLTEEDLKELNQPTAEEIPTVPKQNLSAEDMQLMGLSADSEIVQETNKSDHDLLQSSCSPQSSQAPLQATPAAVAASGGSKGYPLYAELEHKKGKQSIITPPDMTGVQYSEIRIDEIPPCLAQKKLRKGRDHSSSSLVTSAPGSTSSLDTLKDSPTYPLYTDVMNTAEEIPTVPKLNHSVKDIQQMDLSTAAESETVQETNPSPTTANKQDHNQSQSSCSAQSSEAPLKATPAAVAVSGSKGDPLYADLEHKKGKESIIIPPDMTGVQYSEIMTCTDEIPPRLPQKKSRKGRDHSSSSPVTSAPGSTSSLDTLKV